MTKRILALLLTLALVLPAVSCDILLADPNAPATPSDSQSESNNNTPDTERVPSKGPEVHTQPETPPDSEPPVEWPGEPQDSEQIDPPVDPEPETEYIPKEFKVTFMLEGYDHEYGIQLVKEGNTVGKPQVSIDPAIGSFDGIWYTDPHFKQVFDFGTYIAGDITLFGRFVPNPAAPALLITPEQLAEQASEVGGYAQGIASADVMTNGSNSFVRLTASNGDPYFMAAQNCGKMPDYLVIRYRTNSEIDGEIFIGSGNGPHGVGDHCNIEWNGDNEWHLAIIHLPSCGVSTIKNGVIDYLRIDFFRHFREGDYIDFAYIAFFNSPEYAKAYDFEHYPPYVEKEAAGMKAHSFDTFFVNEQMYFEVDGGAGDKLTAINNTIPFDAGAAHDTMSLRGWIGFDQAIEAFGYYVDGYDFVWGEFAQATEDGVLAAGGENASRFCITVPLTSLTSGTEHKIGFILKLADGTVVRLREEIKVIIVPTHTEKTVTLGIRNSDIPFTGGQLKFGQRFQLAEGFLKSITVDAMATYDDGNVNKWAFRVWQWKGDYATTVASTPLYETFGENHENCRAFTVAIPATAYVTGDIFYEIEYVEGSKFFTGWTAGDLYAGIESYVDGALKDGGYAASIVVGVKFEGEYVEGDLTNVFASDISTNVAGTDLKKSDLSGYFTVEYGAGDPHLVDNVNGSLQYTIGTFNAMTALPNGKYAFSVKDLVTRTPGFSGMLVRALRNATPEKQFYGGDGHDADARSYGGSGIYIAMEDADTLRINIKSYVDGIYVPNIYTATVTSNDITVADDGEVVYILSGDALVATIAINGTKDYGIAGVAADVASASATLTINGQTYEIADAILAAACDVENSIGLATRGGGNMTFSGVTVAGFSTVTLPGAGEPETPAVENYNVPMESWTVSGHQPQLIIPDVDGVGPMVAAAGVEKAALLHQGSVGVGEVDLSKYSKVVIYWGSDNSQVTMDRYNENAHNRIMLLSADMNMMNSPTEDTIIAGSTYTLHGWKVEAHEIDLTDVDYNGPVYVTWDTLPGTFMVIASVEFVA